MCFTNLPYYLYTTMFSAAMGNRLVRGKPLPTPNYPDSSVSIERNVDDDELDDFDEDYDVRISTDYIDSLVSDLCTLITI